MTKPPRGKLTRKHVEAWLGEQDMSDETERCYRRCALAFVGSVKPGTRGWRERAMRFRKSLQDRGLSSATQAGYVVAARQFLAWAVDEKLVEENPLTKVRVRVGKGSPRRALSKEEVRALVTGIGEDDERALRDRALIILMVYTGLRVRGVAEALVGDLDRSEETPVLRYRGKGHTSKDASVRLHPHVVEALDAYLETRSWPPGEAPLFCAPNRPSKNVTEASLRRDITARLRDAGIKGASPHSLRHTYATQMLKAGADLHDIQDGLNHASINTTMRYVHRVSREERAAEMKLDFGLDLTEKKSKNGA